MAEVNLDEYADLVGKMTAEQIAATAGASLDAVNAWLAAQGAQVTAKSRSKRKAEATDAPTPAAQPVAPRTIESIQVTHTTKVTLTNARGRPVSVTVPKSIYRGSMARKYASLLKPGEFTVLSES